ncbi:MAG: hypothetical protein K6D37_06105 [Prevotella sp.]|nr:hypothetical protein [Prevotella sp.]
MKPCIEGASEEAVPPFVKILTPFEKILPPFGKIRTPFGKILPPFEKYERLLEKYCRRLKKYERFFEKYCRRLGIRTMQGWCRVLHKVYYQQPDANQALI